jgi:hypothetical protein
MFVVLKSYFDGGNHPDSRVHDVLTLAVVTGTKQQWRPLERAWRNLMTTSGVGNDFHTTDLVALSDPFSRRNGGDESRRDLLLGRCVGLIERYIARQIRGDYPGRLGLYPFTVTVPLAEHGRARNENPDAPNNAAVICSTQAIGACLEWGQHNMKADAYHLVFDRGEQFRGPAYDRWINKKAVREFPELGKISSITDADSSITPALQVADLYAWCVSQKNKRDFEWQRRLLALDRQDEIIPYELLIHPVKRAVDLAGRFNFPARKANP